MPWNAMESTENSEEWNAASRRTGSGAGTVYSKTLKNGKYQTGNIVTKRYQEASAVGEKVVSSYYIKTYKIH